MRAYYFGNMYLSSIQQGIQAAHVTADMFVKYPYDSSEHQMLSDWAADHKTMILLNGGYASELERLVDLFTYGDNPYPWAYFRESQDAMQQCITSVGIVLPEHIWIGAKQLREGWVEVGEMARHGYVSYDDWNDNMKPVKYDISKWEFENIICQLNNYGLAK